MRLTQKEVSSILSVFRNLELLPECKIFLFGSRLDQQKKGGDIDLMVVCPEYLYLKILENKFRIKSEIEFVVGEQRVDLTLATPQKLESELFLKSIKDEAIELST